MTEAREPLKTLPDVNPFEFDALDYDDIPWPREELEALAWERVKDEALDEYDLLATQRMPTDC